MKKIIYLGGFFQSEFSIQRSFLDKGVEILFLIDDNDYAKCYWNNPEYVNYGDYYFIKVVHSDNLEFFLREYKPDLIIHRFWLYQTFMHINSRIIAKKLDIPFIHLEMEDDPISDFNLERASLDCDLFLYAHDRILKIVEKRLSKDHIPFYFYPYGVSSFERGLPNILKDREAGSFGYPRIQEYDRTKNLDMFLEGVEKLKTKLHVYGNWGFNPWIKYFRVLEIHPRFQLEETTEVMNRHKIAINFETFPWLEGAYSHKMFQTIGCGIPTLTNYRESVMNLFKGSPNPIFVSNSGEVFAWLETLRDETLWKVVSKEGEKFIHNNFDWFNRFNTIIEEDMKWR